MSDTKRKLSISLVTMLITVFMLLGSTYAWFTDSTSNTGNRIQAGTLDIDLLMDKTLDGSYVSIDKGTGDIFKEAAKAQNSNETLWEPGKTQVVFLAVENKGNLALKYNAYIDVTDEGLVGSLEYLLLPISSDEYNTNFASITNWEDLRTAAATYGITSAAVVAGRNVITSGILDEIYESDEQNERDYVALVVHMMEDAGNEYQGKDAIIDVAIVATQATAELDGFGTNTYDENAEGLTPAEPIHTSVVTNNTVKTETTDTLTFTTSGDVKSATLAKSSAAALFVDNQATDTSKDMVLNLDVNTTENTLSSVTYDLSLYKTITTDGVKGEPAKVTDELATYLTTTIDIGPELKNVKVTHSGNEMEALSSADGTPTNINGGYYYDSETGILTIKSKTFSPFKVTFDHKYGGGSGTPEDPYIISSIEHLYDMSSDYKYNDLVGEYCNFNCYKLTADLTVKNWTIATIHYTELGGSAVMPDCVAFGGQFDGNGHTIKFVWDSDVTEVDGNDGVSLFGEFIDSIGIEGYDRPGVMKNLTIDCDIDAKCDISPMFAYIWGDDCTVDNCHIKGTIKSEYYACGISLYANIGTGVKHLIKNCSFDADLIVNVEENTARSEDYYYLSTFVTQTVDSRKCGVPPIIFENCTVNGSITLPYCTNIDHIIYGTFYAANPAKPNECTGKNCVDNCTVNIASQYNTDGTVITVSELKTVN